MLCFLTNNNSAARSFRSFEGTNKSAASFLSSPPGGDLSPVFNPVTCKIPDHDLGPASLFPGQKTFGFVLAVNRTHRNLVPEECHSRALHRETLTTGPN